MRLKFPIKALWQQFVAAAIPTTTQDNVGEPIANRNNSLLLLAEHLHNVTLHNEDEVNYFAQYNMSIICIVFLIIVCN
jgi:hypothetical protein